VDYCSLAEALALLPSVGTLRDAVSAVEADPEADPPVLAAAAVTATMPSATQAAVLLAQATTEIDMHLDGQGYVTPAIGKLLTSVKPICMNGAAAKIAKAMWPSATGAGGDNGAVITLREDYAAGLAFIDKGGLNQDSVQAGSNVDDGFPRRHHYSHHHDGYGRRFYAGYPDPF